MALTKWTPQNELAHMQSNFDRLFRRMISDHLPEGMKHQITDSGEWWPVIDIGETDDEYIVQAEIPGVTEKDIDISVRNDVLTIKGETTPELKDNESRYYRERSYGKFQRAVRLDTAVNADKVNAEYRNGVLTVTLPKIEDSKPRQIPVKSAKK